MQAGAQIEGAWVNVQAENITVADSAVISASGRAPNDYITILGDGVDHPWGGLYFSIKCFPLHLVIMGINSGFLVRNIMAL